MNLDELNYDNSLESLFIYGPATGGYSKAGQTVTQDKANANAAPRVTDTAGTVSAVVKSAELTLLPKRGRVGQTRVCA